MKACHYLPLVAMLATLPAWAADQTPRGREKPFLAAELIFPLEPWHDHGSCIVECPNGDLLVCWYHGSGERTADDVRVMGARWKKGAKGWSTPFGMADTPGYPDTNPTMFIDPQKRLWLLWPVILANRWETALMKYRISSNYERPGAPQWQINEVLHVTPGTEFRQAAEAGLNQLTNGPAPEMKPEEFEKWLKEKREMLGDKLSCRLGWMTRAHPYVLDSRRLILPLYSDGLECCLMAISDDWGRTWFTSSPLVGMINSQPSLVRKEDGTLVAFMRDDGSAVHRVQLSESKDRGVTWSPVVSSDRPDPGAGVEAIVLKDGAWVLINNDLEHERHSLAVSLSDDEGKTWKWKRHLEQDSAADIQAGAGSYHYPSIIQAKDGTLHATYSYHEKKSQTLPAANGKPASESIKHAHFNEAWIRAGDPLR
jgi:predicted neuraminidase